MSRIFMAFALALAVTSVSVGMEPYQPIGEGGAFDPFAAPTPSGLRFAGADTTVRTGGPAGDPGAGPCNTCGNMGVCIDWKLYGWYGSWDGRHHHGCKRACRPCGSY